jgi:simple sugar transport system ATP-binding protein
VSCLLETRELTKRFGGLTAVDRVSVGVRAGEALALLGDNGAGKSTLIKMISGVYAPDGGEILMDGKPVRIASPMDALAAGIETIYQDLALAENLDVGANIFLGRERTRRFLGLFTVVDDAAMRAEAQKVLDRLDIHIPSLRATIRTLSGGQRQAVAISRSIYWKAKVLIMDEPTAALGIAEQRKVVNLVQTLKAQGLGIIIISHQMYEVFEMADRIAVMRRGVKVAERLVRETTPDEVVGLIVGTDVVASAAAAAAADAAAGATTAGERAR